MPDLHGGAGCVACLRRLRLHLEPKLTASQLCILGAIIVACTGHDGWGWLLFVAVLVD